MLYYSSQLIKFYQNYYCVRDRGHGRGGDHVGDRGRVRGCGRDCACVLLLTYLNMILLNEDIN